LVGLFLDNSEDVHEDREQRVAVNPCTPFRFLQNLDSEQSVTNGRLKFATRHPRGDSSHDKTGQFDVANYRFSTLGDDSSGVLRDPLFKPHNGLVANRQMRVSEMISNVARRQMVLGWDSLRDRTGWQSFNNHLLDCQPIR
jgi:hypothetical protein